MPVGDNNNPGPWPEKAPEGAKVEGMILDIKIPGAPVGKGRPRFARMGKFVRTYTPDATTEWEAFAVTQMRAGHPGAPVVECVRVEVEAVGKRPKTLLPKDQGGSAPRSRPPEPGRMWRPKKPDADNVLKIVLDALIKAGVIVDDVQAVSVEGRSLYAALGESAHVAVRVRVVGECGAAWGGR